MPFLFSLMIDILSLVGNLINIYIYIFRRGASTAVARYAPRPGLRQPPEEVETLRIGVPDKLKYLADSARFVFAHRTVGILMRFG